MGLSFTLFENIKMSFLNVCHTTHTCNMLWNWRISRSVRFMRLSWRLCKTMAEKKEVYESERWKWLVLTRSQWINETTFQRLASGPVANIIVLATRTCFLVWDLSGWPFNGVFDIKWFLLFIQTQLSFRFVVWRKSVMQNIMQYPPYVEMWNRFHRGSFRRTVREIPR